MSGTGQLGFAEAFMSAGLGSNRKLERLDALIDWSRLERLASSVREGRRGRPPYAPLAMLKALYLQALYDLSDPALEEALLDRLSFRRFCGFALDGGTPDETTICRFRADAGAVLEAAFEEINRQLDAAGLILHKGTLMDATLVASASRPPPYKAGAGAGHPREPGADWTRKKDRIMHRRNKHMAPLPPWQRRNDLIARRRAPVEAVFSALQRLYGLRRARSLSLERNTARLYAAATAYNLRRASLIAGC